jgi:HK97 gp10 family phage protein
VTITVTGIAQLNRDLRKLGIDMEDMKDAMARLADMGAKAAVRHVPHRSGALAGSIRGNRAKGKAVVTAGRGATSQYAGVINYGSPGRGIAAQPFMQQADADVSPKIVPILSADIDRLIRERGLK